MTRKKRRKRETQQTQPLRRELHMDELTGIVERAKASLTEEEHATLLAAVETLVFLTQELEAKGATLERLRKLLFGARTEKTSDVLGEEPAGEGAGAPADAAGEGAAASETTSPKPKRPGHGRNGSAAYRGATKITVPHATLHGGCKCPTCNDGKVYPLSRPLVLVRVRGMAPLQATLYELGQLRCNLCGEVFTAEAPAGIGNEKYDETAAAMIGLLRYGAGLPFNRIEKLEQGFGIPLPAGTQWEVVERAAGLIAPAHEELIRQAAQGDVVHNDDTPMRILDLQSESRKEGTADGAADDAADERTGVYTSGIVAVGQGHRIALFFTGRKHAGENLETVLAKRAKGLPVPIQMADMLSHNTAGEFTTILAGCMAHSRRRYVDVVENFPAECRYVLETLGAVYKNDAIAKKRELSPEQRLQFHQAESEPVMKELEKWLREQIEERKVEPNSSLGHAICFMRKYWTRLTLFLRVAGAPLDNNICERSLKMAIRHRKNSLFYKTLNGAKVGDAFMSLIHTADLNSIDAFDYLVALQRHYRRVAANPGDWMPWNYKETLARPPEDSVPPP